MSLHKFIKLLKTFPQDCEVRAYDDTIIIGNDKFVAYIDEEIVLQDKVKQHWITRE